MIENDSILNHLGGAIAVDRRETGREAQGLGQRVIRRWTHAHEELELVDERIDLRRPGLPVELFREFRDQLGIHGSKIGGFGSVLFEVVQLPDAVLDASADVV